VSRLSAGAVKLGGFALTVVLSGAANILTIPAVVSAIGPHAWAAIAMGQAVGAVGCTVVQLGWGVTGPAEVASASTDQERVNIYIQSLRYRALTVVPVLLVVSAVAFMLAPDEFRVASCIAALGGALFGLTASWFFVGIGKPMYMLFLDTIPRSGAIVLGAFVVSMVKLPSIFAGAILLSSLLPLATACFVVLKKHHLHLLFKRFNWHETKTILQAQRAGVTASIVATGYRDWPLVFVSAVAPSYAPSYALIDRLLRFAMAGVKPFAQVLQGWVPAGSKAHVSKRITIAVAASSIMAVLAGFFFVLLGPAVSQRLGADAIVVGLGLLVPAGLALAVNSMSQTTGLACLMAVGKKRTVALSMTVGAGVCVSMLVLTTMIWGVGAAIWCVAVAEITVLSMQLFGLRSQLRSATA
jgi:O-antigen/teichoic acid export membrane protein